LTSDTALRVVLVVAALGALIVVLGFFGEPIRIACLVLIAAASVATAPWRSSRGGGWWWILAAGATASIAGAILAQPAATLGGVVALIGGLAVIVGAAIGFPTDDSGQASR
jgi:hypothetical protein